MLNNENVEQYIKDNNGKGDYVLADSGDGNFIYKWDMDIPEPTNEQLIAASANIVYPEYEPTDLEIRLDALEKKTGVTQSDKDASRQAIIDAKA